MLLSLSLCLLTLLFSVGVHSRNDNPNTCGEKVSGLRSCISLDSQELGARQKVLVNYKIQ